MRQKVFRHFLPLGFFLKNVDFFCDLARIIVVALTNIGVFTLLLHLGFVHTVQLQSQSVITNNWEVPIYVELFPLSVVKHQMKNLCS